MIEIKDLKKSFGELHVLQGITTTVNKGDKVVVVGPSGSGKSTFLRCLNLLEMPDSGEIWFEGKQINAPKADVDKLRCKMGMVFQHFNLFPHLTILGNITLAPVLLKLKTKEEADAQAKELLSRIGLLDKADTYPAMLSGGQKQRVAIASALCAGKKILIYDEPTSGLDYESMRCACALIREVSRQAELSLVITHDLEFIMACCTCVLHIDHGTVKAFYPLDNRGKARVKKEFLLQ